MTPKSLAEFVISDFSLTDQINHGDAIERIVKKTSGHLLSVAKDKYDEDDYPTKLFQTEQQRKMYQEAFDEGMWSIIQFLESYINAKEEEKKAIPGICRECKARNPEHSACIHGEKKNE